MSVLVHQICPVDCRPSVFGQSVNSVSKQNNVSRLHHPQRRADVRSPTRAASSRDESNQPDLIERLFSGLFGKSSLSAEEPGGMKRLSKEVYQQQQPATTTEFAALLEGDKEEIRFFRPLLAHTSLEQLPLR